MDPTPTRFLPGDIFPLRELVTIDSSRVRVPDPAHAFVHVRFRRYAGCPICNLHLRSIVTRHAELLAAGLREIVVFHSSADDLRKVHERPPTRVLARQR